MTNEEARSELQALVTHYNAFSKESAAICKAIDALSTPPDDNWEDDNWEGYSQRLWKAAYERGKADAKAETCEDVSDTNVGDMVSRQAVIYGLDTIEIKRNATWYELYQEAINMINDLPSVTPEIKAPPKVIRKDGIEYCKDCIHAEMCS